MMRRQIRSAGTRSTDHLIPFSEKRSVSGDRPQSHRSYRGEARSTRSHSRSSVLDIKSPGDRIQHRKSNDNIHDVTKDALSNLLIRKNELESKGIETEIMYKELMNCVSPWRQKKLQQEAEESQAALDDAIKAADELMKQAKDAFDAYQKLQDSKRKDAAAGDLFWKSKVMHKTLMACIQVARNAESARDQVSWSNKMGKIMTSMMAVFQILDDLKNQLSKERALSKSLSSLVQRGGELGDLDLSGHGDDEVALLLASATAALGDKADAGLFPSRWRFLRGGWLPLLLSAALLGTATLAGSWLAGLDGPPAEEVLRRLREAAEGALRSAGLLSARHQLSWLEAAQLWLVSLGYGLVCWVPGLCAGDAMA